MLGKVPGEVSPLGQAGLHTRTEWAGQGHSMASRSGVADSSLMFNIHILVTTIV
jgi:hypothetical protein